MQAIGFIFLLITAFLLVEGCTALPGGAEIHPSNALPQNTPVNGIVQTDENEIYLLYIHGMGATEPNFYEDFINRGIEYLPSSKRYIDKKFGNGTCDSSEQSCLKIELPNTMHIRGEGLRCSQSTKNDAPCQITNFGELRKIVVKNDQRTVNIYIYYWDSAADKIQDYYTYTDNNIDKFRPYINKTLKKKIVTYGFSDAALYLGNLRTSPSA